jgi:ATP-dependent helicase HrpB
LAAPIDEAKLEPLAQVREVLGWDSAAGALVARREQRIGELVLASKPLAQAPSTEQRIQLLLDVVRAEGLTLLNWTDAARSWQARAQCLHLWRGADWPDVSDASLLARCQEWLAPWLSEVTKRADFARLDVLAMLETVLTHQQQRQLEVLAPTHLAVPSGSRIRLAYALDGAAPGLAVKLQEVFGLADTPTVNEGRTKVMLHLLSPAQRPVQVTQDLRSFWTNTYPAVRKELRGRYNKHPWPADPWHAPPTRKTVKAATKL